MWFIGHLYLLIGFTQKKSNLSHNFRTECGFTVWRKVPEIRLLLSPRNSENAVLSSLISFQSDAS